MRYEMAYAKVQDSNRNFLNAAQSYYKTSNREGVEAESKDELLDCTLKCLILSPSGPRKAHLLA